MVRTWVKHRPCKCDSNAKGHIENNSCLSEEKENTGIGCNDSTTKKNVIRRKMTNSSSSIAAVQQHTTEQVYTNTILVRRAAAYNNNCNLSGQVNLLCNHTLGLPNQKRNNSK